MGMEWEPILDGADADRAWRILRAVADGLAALDAPAPDLALFWAYAAAAFDDEVSAARAAAATARFGAHLVAEPTERLFGGVAGGGWIAAHIADGVDDALAAIDRRLVHDIDAWAGPYDFVGGLAGLAVYFLAREDDAALARIVDRLAGLATTTPHGLAWHTRPDWLAPHARATHPGGRYDCGLSHGVPGAIAVLAKIAARGNARAATLRDDALVWLLAQRLPSGRFPAIAGEPWTRAAWCYGDPGVALALWHAGRRDDPAILGWLAHDDGVLDAGLCHGSAGLAHVANRLYHATGDPRGRDAARTWYARVLDAYRPGAEVAGFTMQVNETPTPLARFLDGTIGVGLALISAVAPIEPAWDALLLCDL